MFSINWKIQCFYQKGLTLFLKYWFKDRDDSELYDLSKKLRFAIHAVFLYRCNLLHDNMALSKIQWIISQTSQENEEALISPFQKWEYIQLSNHLVPCHTGSSAEWRNGLARDSSTDQWTILHLHFPNWTVQSHTNIHCLTKSFS